MPSLADIERLTKLYSDARGVLSERVSALNAEIDDAKRRKLPGIKAALSAAAEAEANLDATIARAAHLFEKPRTAIFHGIKVGFQKGKGGIEWEHQDQVIRLIRKHLPEQAEVLIKITEKLAKSALNNLDVAELRKIGCTAVETGDQVLIKPVDSDVDKLVAALLKSATEEADQE